jgi:phospholipid transport system substrate-binding protein
MTVRAAAAGLLALMMAALAGAPQAGAADPSANVRRFYDALGSATQRPGGASTEAIRSAVTANFDLDAMLQQAVGSRWQSIPADRQPAIRSAFARYFVGIYADRFRGAENLDFQIGTLAERGSNTLVRSRVIAPDGTNAAVDFVVAPSGKVIDVYLGGVISEVAGLRIRFQDALLRGGPDALLDLLGG